MNIINKWKDKIAQSIGDKVESVKLNFIDKTSTILGYFLFVFIAIFLSLAILIFLGMGLSELFSDLFDSKSGGYFATAGVYALVVTSLFVFRQSIVDFFAGSFIGMLTKQEKEDDEDEEEEENN